MCIEITGTGTTSGANPITGTILAYVNDKCPSCPSGGVDLSASKDGVWDISWKAVDCPVGNTYLQYMWEGSHEYYIKLQVINHRIPISNVEFQVGGNWYTGVRTDDNHWNAPSSGFPYPFTLPLTVRVTGINNEAVIDRVPQIAATGVIVNGMNNVQFSSVRASGSPPTPPTVPSPTGGTGSTTPPTSSTPSTPVTPSQTISDTGLPSNIPAPGGTFTASLSYTTNTDAVITLDVLQKGTWTWYANDKKEVLSGTGTVSFTITTPSTMPTTSITLKAWIIPKSTFYSVNNPWDYYTAQFFKDVTVGGGGASPPATPPATPATPVTPAAPVSAGVSATLTKDLLSTYLDYSIRFYEAQRSGKLPSSTNRIPWRGDTFLADGSDNQVDLSGGYFDAGDHFKFNLPCTYAMTVLSWSAITYQQGYVSSGQWGYIKDAIKWGTDYFLKSYNENNKILWGQVGKSGMHSIWKPPENYTQDEINQYRISYKLTATSPGSDLIADTAAAFASASIVFANDDPTYSSLLLSKARSLYTWAKSSSGSKYSDVITDANPFYTSWSGGNDEICLAAAWLYKATSEPSFLQDALSDTYWNSVSSANGPMSWDNKGVAAKVLLASLAPNESKVTTAAKSWADSILSQSLSTDGLLWFDVSQWGSNRHAMNAIFPLLVYADTVEKNAATKASYINKAREQLEYIFGKNSQNVNYMVGAHSSSPKRCHHRGASGTLSASDPAPNPNVLYGALVGGPGGDGSYQDKRDDYVKNEVALDYNAGLTGNLARFIQYCEPVGCTSTPAPPAGTPSSSIPLSPSNPPGPQTTSSLTTPVDSNLADGSNSDGGLAGWAVALIVIVVLLILGGIIGFVIYKFVLKKGNEMF
eukprot:TRINITY_DN900_c0_g2_i2.p1 TRINITY_DN900_c0_g2~~TRINITY_DN900_c0_g2_i2.p1  ORF type:complete len:960 (-),score=228.16 TRINITY_DN900_c0_g2_i2:22-2625(-)